MAQRFLILVFVLIIAMVLTLVSCGPEPRFASTPEARMLLGTPESSATNDPAITAIMLTQEQERVEAEAAATAEMARAIAQAALNSANATLGVSQTQAQNDANQLAAQLTATAAVGNANAQSTLIAAAATQAAAQTQDSITQTQAAALATSNAQATLDQQNRDVLAAGTQTAVAETIATQTQIAVVTAQWYDIQKREREERLQGPISFLWLVCFPAFMIAFAILTLWGVWRWLRIQQANQRALKNPVQVFQAPQPRPSLPPQADPLYLDSSVVDHHPHLTKPEDPVNEWLDEVKNELLNEEKDQDDNTNS